MSRTVPLKKWLTDAEVDHVVQLLDLAEGYPSARARQNVVNLAKSLCRFEDMILHGRWGKDQTDYLERLRRDLSSLHRALNRGDPATNRVLGSALSPQLSRILSDEGLAILLPAYAGRFQPAEPSRIHELAPVPDWEAAAARQRVVEKNATRLLERLVGLIDGQVGELLAGRSRDKGGGQAKEVRNAAIRGAASIFWEATGTCPTTTRDGPFANFCEAFFEMIGLPTGGLSNALVQHMPRYDS